MSDPYRKEMQEAMNLAKAALPPGTGLFILVAFPESEHMSTVCSVSNLSKENQKELVNVAQQLLADHPHANA